MTLLLSISERIRQLRQEIAELELADKIGPRDSPVSKSDRERRRQRLQEIRDEIKAMSAEMYRCIR
jgi:hypothetical protein